jgi:BolA protein
MEERIRRRLGEGLRLTELHVVNESSQHSVPPGSETHFRVGVVSEEWEGQGALARHRRVHALLRDELRDGVHALTVEAWTPAQWAARGAELQASPPCLGGSKSGG